MGLQGRANGGQIQRVELRLITDPDRALGVAHLDVLKSPGAAIGGKNPDAVLPGLRRRTRPRSIRQVVEEVMVGRISPAAVWIENWSRSVQPERRR
jgi:hypothetical protein